MAQIIDIYETLLPEDQRRVDAFATALLYDQDHPGANTAERLREETLREINAKEHANAV